MAEVKSMWPNIKSLADDQAFVSNLTVQFFWATVCKTVRPMLSVCCLSVLLSLSVLSVCNVRALWPNGWTDQDETWRADRPRPWPHCVRW